MLEKLKRRVCEANKMLARYGLGKLTWENVSTVNRGRQVIVIKPSRAENSLILEEVAKMALLTEAVHPDSEIMQKKLLGKHYFCKHGANTYYDQVNG